VRRVEGADSPEVSNVPDGAILVAGMRNAVRIGFFTRMSIGHALLGTGDSDGCRSCAVVSGVRSTVGRRNGPGDTGKAGGNYGSFALCLRIMPGFVFRVKRPHGVSTASL
jgi:hypothetical protein